jgi:acyl-CoA oxidase
MRHLRVGHNDGGEVQAADASDGVSMAPCSSAVRRTLPRFDSNVLANYLDDLRSMKNEVYELFRQHPELLPAIGEGMSKEEHRELCRKHLRLVLEAGYNPMKFFANDYKKYFYLAELYSLIDLSSMVKMGVQYSLWGGSVVNLGTERHREKYFDDIDSFRLPGCFAMTELRHGSNVAGLQTEAMLDIAADEWDVHTPDEGAIKWWIGNAAEDGRAATVFARLRVPAPDGSGTIDDHGVHAFIVPLRDDAGVCLPGVEIHDCGYKVGLNGVDNGAIRFTHVRIPRENLLDRFASVDRAGRYSSPLPSAGKRFAATLGELTGGRVGLTAGSLGVLKGAATIAIRYAAQRQQFGPPDGSEIAVLDYQSLQWRLMPMLATTYALHFAKNQLVDMYCEMKRSRDEELIADVHSFSAGLKAYTTSYTANALSVCREACGGHGYAAINRLGALRSDHDIFQTFEGDNTVLLQQVAAMLLKRYKDSFAGGGVAATWTYLRQWALGALPPNPLTSHDTGPRHLRDPAFLKRALRYRVARLLHTVAQRLRKHTRRLGAFHAWNKCLNHLLALARAHQESVMLDAFYAGVTSCVDPECRKSLKAMADLFALKCIYEEALFRNDDYVSPEKAKAIARMIEELCLEVRGVAVPLCAAFAIPDHILRAPIGLATGHEDQYGAYLAAIGWGPFNG